MRCNTGRAAMLCAIAALLTLLLCSCDSGAGDGELYEGGSVVCADVCYVGEGGLLVPIRTEVDADAPHQDALSMLCGERADRAPRGLEAPLPKDCGASVRVEDGVATVTFDTVPVSEDAQAEERMAEAVVYTLTSFVDVDGVVFDVEGGELPLKTAVDKTLTRGALNPEDGGVRSAAAEGEGYELTLYFPCYDSSYCVPVTRVVQGEPTLDEALDELLKGPDGTVALRPCFPDGTRLIKVTAEGGVAKIELSKEAENLLEHPLLSERAQECVDMLCADFGIPETQAANGLW